MYPPEPAIRAVTIRALREGCEVIGIRRGWLGWSTLSAKRTMQRENFQHCRRIWSTGRAAPAVRLHTSRH